MKTNKHYQNRLHKKMTKKRYINSNYNATETVFSAEQKEKQNNSERSGTKYYEERNNGFTYWDILYLSGPRQVAKNYTNSRIRTKYRNLLKTKDFEEIEALSNADYRKESEYDWIIW